MSAKQLLYLGSRTDEAKSLCEENNIVPMLIHTDNANSLYTFVKTEKSLSNMDFFVVDVRDSSYSKEHIIQSLIACKNMPRFRVILITGDKILAQHTVQMGIKDVITSNDKSDNKIWEELLDCIKSEKSFSQNTVTLQNGLKEIIKEKTRLPEIPKGRILDIGVFGCCPRIGVTTQAIGLYRFFTKHDASAVLVDHSRSLLGFSQMYSSYREEDGFQWIENIRLLPGEENFNFKEEETSYKVRIHDLGVLSEKSLDNALSCDISILCCGSSVYEVTALAQIMEDFHAEEFIKLFTFTSDKGFQEVCKEIFPDSKEAVCAPYMPDFLEAQDDQFYKSFIVRKMKETISQWNS